MYKSKDAYDYMDSIINNQSVEGCSREELEEVIKDMVGFAKEAKKALAFERKHATYKPTDIQDDFMGDFYEGCPVCGHPITHKWKVPGDISTTENPTHCENCGAKFDWDENVEETIEKLLKFLKERFPDGIQCFDCHNWMRDYTTVIYEEGNIIVYYAPDYDYIEIIGLNKPDFETISSKLE